MSQIKETSLSHVSQKEQMCPQGRKHLVFMQLSFLMKINEGENSQDLINISIFSLSPSQQFPLKLK